MYQNTVYIFISWYKKICWFPINKRFAVKSLHIIIAGSTQLNNKLKATSKISLRTQQAAAATKNPSNRRKQWRLNRDNKKTCKRRIKRSPGKSYWDYQISTNKR